MPIAHPQTDAEFNQLIANVGTTPIVVDFFAEWCGPCRNIAPIFQQLSQKYINLKYAKVNTDKCKESARSNQVNAMPTFMVFLNCQKMDALTGANPTALEGLIRKWSENCPSQLESPIPGQMDLQGLIDRSQCECLNEHDNHNLQAFLSGSGRLVSDVDEQLIINLKFQQPVKIHSIRLGADDAKAAPRNVKLFINSARTLDFDSAQSFVPVQTLTFEKEEDIKPLYYVKFQNVTNLQLFVENNQGDTEQTIIDRLNIYGTPIASVNMQDFKRIAGKAGEVGH